MCTRKYYLLNMSNQPTAVFSRANSAMPADIPSTGIFSITREANSTFLVIYNKASVTTASRFTLGQPTSTPVVLDSADIGYIGFSSVAHAQDSTTDYFFTSNSVSTSWAKSTV